MTFLPIVERELRTRARQSSTYWLRCGAALVASGIAGVMMIAALIAGPGALGQAMFAAMAWPLWLFCLVEGLRNTADCLSEEKREGTLGLLFLTDLKGYDVVLGKFMASSLGALFSLLATLPLLALPLLWGGVTAGEFWRLALALADTLFFSLCAGLFVSAISRQERHAWLGSLAIVGCCTAVLPFLAAGLGAGGLSFLLTLASPWTVFQSAFASGYAKNPRLFWDALLLVPLLGWLGLTMGSVLLPGAWQEKGLRAGRSRWKFFAPHRASAGARTSKRARPMDGLPMSWLATRDDERRALIWIPVVAAGAFAVVVWADLNSAARPIVLWSAGLVLHAGLTLWVAWEACHSFSDLRRSGLLELLLAAPLRTRQIIQGQDQALRRLFLGPFLGLLALELVLLGAYSANALSGRSGTDGLVEVLVATLLVGGSLTLFALDVVAVARVGMWLSLTSPKPAQAWGKTVLWVQLVPLLVSVLPLFLCCGIATPAILAAKSILFCSWAHGKLLTDFRATAAQPWAARSEKWWRWK